MFDGKPDASGSRRTDMRADAPSPGREPTRVAIADDHAIFRQGLRALLANWTDEVRIVAEVERLEALEEILAAGAVDLLLLDLQMERNALDEIARLAERVPILVLTASEQVDELVAATQAGACGIVLKRFAVETLLEAIRTIRAGDVWVPPAVQTELAAAYRAAVREPLTPREREVARGVALGLRNAAIARRLFIGEQTVKTHLASVFRKLGVHDRVELTRHAIRTGLVGLHDRPPLTK